MNRVLFEASIMASDVLVHIGAGAGEDLPQYIKLRESRPIVLVEPNPELAAELRVRARHLPNITVIEAAVAAAPGDANLNVFNIAARSSLRTPVGLKDIYPGLRTVKTVDVETQTVAELLDEAADDDATFTLVVDAPGEEQAILDALVDSGRIDRCRYLLVHSPAVSNLYQESKGGNEVRTCLGKQKCRQLAHWPENDPEFIVTLYDVNRGVLVNDLIKKYTLSQRDLLELQERYKMLIATKETQDEVLRDLSSSVIRLRDSLERLANGDSAEAAFVQDLLSSFTIGSN